MAHRLLWATVALCSALILTPTASDARTTKGSQNTRVSAGAGYSFDAGRMDLRDWQGSPREIDDNTASCSPRRSKTP